MKKKTIGIIVTSLLLSIMLICLGACGPKEIPQTGLGWTHPENYLEGSVQKSMSATDLFKTVTANFKTAENVTSTEYLVFDGNAGIGGAAQQREMTVTKIVGNKILVTRAAKGLDNNTKGNSTLEKFYFDGTSAYNFLLMDASLKDIDIENPDFTGRKFSDYEGNAADAVADYKTIFSYEIKDSTISAENDDKVYKIGDSFYAAITLKTDKGLNGKVEETLYKNTGAKANSLRFTSETKIYFAAKEINGVMSIVGYEMIENYEFGKSIATVKVAQNFSGKFTYGNVAIADSDLLARE